MLGPTTDIAGLQWKPRSEEYKSKKLVHFVVTVCHPTSIGTRCTLARYDALRSIESTCRYYFNVREVELLMSVNFACSCLLPVSAPAPVKSARLYFALPMETN